MTYQFKDAVRQSQSGRSMGFIAQEVESLFPHLVADCADGFKGLNYGGFSIIAIKAIQELADQNELLASRVGEQQEQIAQLIQRLDAMEEGQSAIRN